MQARQSARRSANRRSATEHESKESKERAMTESCKTLLALKAPILQELGLAQSSRTLDDLKSTKAKMTHQEKALEEEIPKIDHAIATGSGARLALLEELTNSKIEIANGQITLTTGTKKQILDLQGH